MANTTNDPDGEIVPIPGEDNEAERQRIRRSNDRDQRAEQHGERAPHNEGYDEAADGTPARPVNPIDEE
jgi:hypothetical protein